MIDNTNNRWTPALLMLGAREEKTAVGEALFAYTQPK